MRKKLASLTAMFTLAAACSLGTTQAQAQTVPVYPQQHAPVAASAYQHTYNVSQYAIDDIAYNLGVQQVYHRAGTGFTAGVIPQTGQQIGLEFSLDGYGTATVVRAYNLNNISARNAYNNRIQETIQLDNALAARAPLPYNIYPQPVFQPSPIEVMTTIGMGILIYDALRPDHHHHRPSQYVPPRHRDHPPQHHPRNDRPRNDRHNGHRR
jgi:hypothetical protein